MPNPRRICKRPKSIINNKRRRKYSVHHKIAGRPSKFQHTQQFSLPEPNSEPKIGVHKVVVTTRSKKSKYKIFANRSKNISLHILKECESDTSVTPVKQPTSARADKDVTASSSNIDLFHILNDIPEKSRIQNPPNNRQLNRDDSQLKIPRKHRVKVEGHIQYEIAGQTMGTYAIDWEQEIEVPQPLPTTYEEAEEVRPSNHSLDNMCRICHGGKSLCFDLEQLISACSCRETVVGRVHVKSMVYLKPEQRKKKPRHVTEYHWN